MPRPSWSLLGMMLSLLLIGAAPRDDDLPAAAPTPKAQARAKAQPARRRADVPPACPSPVANRPRPANRGQMPMMGGSMPEMFARMGESFARDPANGFQNFLNDLSRLEGPAVEGIRLTIDEERAAGKKARDEFLQQAAARGAPEANSPEKLAYLRQLVDGFAARMQHRDRYPEIDVRLIQSPVPDGQSFPGGYLVFTTGLLDEPDEATVAGVVAHELAHLDRGHLYGYARRTKLAEATFTDVSGPGFGGPNDFDRFFTRQMALFGLLMNPYRPEHESEADCTSVTWMYLEGYDPRALVKFFERLHDRLNDGPPNPFFSFGRSHPFSLDRRRAVLARLDALKRWRRRDDLGLYAENLRRHVSHFQERAEAAEAEAPADPPAR